MKDKTSILAGWCGKHTDDHSLPLNNVVVHKAVNNNGY